MPPYKRYTGISKKGFEDATHKAVAAYEKDWGPPGKLVRLEVVEMYVRVVNPVRDYIVTLGPGT
jgi:hypothetical protein